MSPPSTGGGCFSPPDSHDIGRSLREVEDRVAADRRECEAAGIARLPDCEADGPKTMARADGPKTVLRRIVWAELLLIHGPKSCRQTRPTATGYLKYTHLGLQELMALA